ncbi:Hypothetical predicted protein [Pelobates cultripes]|uniref:Uncharacterized protein n=1 Tax=Pelobates cultripes TaxID=61616 RepID=A0AAD1WXE2_PELCU|nr:Hypothetical predicted protein [Pelobates cultripes]
MSQRQKNKADKAERASFFLTRTAAIMPREGGGGLHLEEGPPPSPISSEIGADDSPLTTANMKLLMAERSENIQRNMSAQIHTLTADLRKALLEVGQHTAQVERKMDEFAEAHNSLVDKLQEINAVLHDHALKMADMEDRSWRNNQWIRGITETIVTPKADKLQEIDTVLHDHALKMADMEDRSRHQPVDPQYPGDSPESGTQQLPARPLYPTAFMQYTPLMARLALHALKKSTSLETLHAVCDTMDLSVVPLHTTLE